MNKQILIVFEPASQIHLVTTLISQMRARGLSIDGFNTNKWEYVITDKDIPLVYRLIRKTLFIPQIGRITRRLFQTMLLCRISHSYDLIDLHYFWRTFIPFIKRLRKPYKLTIWGSDFYRELPEAQEKKKPLYEGARVIQVETEDVEKDVLNYHSALIEKIAICNFGADLISLMAQMNFHPNENKDRMVVTLGYNGTTGQQHLKLIEAINELPLNYKDRLFLYVPATYGLTKEYDELLTKALESTSIPYKIYKERLSEKDLALLRFESDIVLNAQITDTFSASLIQHLFAGGILIMGDWLPYGVYDRNEIFYFKSKMEDFTEHLRYVIDNFVELRVKARENRQKVLGFATWNAVSDKQYLIYKQALDS